MRGAPDRLILIVTPPGGRQYSRTIVRDVVFGSDPDCDFPLSSQYASFHHARIEKRSDGFYCIDGVKGIPSKNGVTVKRSAEVISVPSEYGMLLQHDDDITICDIIIKCWFETPLYVPKPCLRVDVGTEQVFKGGVEVTPPPRGHEFELLALLWDARPAVVPHARINDAIWDDPRFPSMHLSKLVQNLREKIGSQYIENRRGSGFCLIECPH